MPLTFDLPLESLYTYNGRNPRPEDFDSYWEKALAEMKATDPDPVIKPSKFQTNAFICEHLFFTGVKGARIHAKLVRPRQQKVTGSGLLRFHGYSMYAGEWHEAFGWAAHGFTVASMDCRGQGGLSQDVGGINGTTLRGHIIRGLDDQPENLLYRDIFLDTAQLANIIMNMDGVDSERVYAMGGSQGGGLTLACAALEPRIKKAAPLFPFLSDYKRVWEMDLAKAAYEELAQYFRRFDPRHEREDEIFNKLGYIDVQHLASRIKAEVMLAVGLADTICPPSTQFAAYNKITAPKSLRLYPDYGHEHLCGQDDEIYQFMLGEDTKSKRQK